MKNLKTIVLILVGIILLKTSQAQIPQFFNNNTGTSSNAFPLSTATSNKVQWLYAPGSFSSLGGGLGTAAYSGAISKVYFRVGAGVSATATYNLTISLAQNLGTILAFPNATYSAVTQCFTDPSFNFTGVVSGAWYGIELQTPFPFDPSQSLIFEMKQTGGTGNQLRQSNALSNVRRWGPFAATVGSGFGTGLVDFGFDLGTQRLYHCPGAPALNLSTINSGNITWSLVSGNATLSATSGQNITALPTNQAVVVANSDANTVVDTFILIPVSGTVDAGTASAVAGCQPFTDNLNASLTDTTVGVFYNIAWAPAANITAGGNTLTPMITQNAALTYTMTVSTDSSQGGCVFTDTVRKDVDNYTPLASFVPDINLGCVNDTVNFFSSSSVLNPNGNPSYLWTYDDGNVGTAANPTHIYGFQNSYDVTLTITDSGCVDDTTITIELRHPLVADFDINNDGTSMATDSICLGSEYLFSPVTIPIAGSGANLNFDWYFGDGTNRLNETAIPQAYRYTQAGTYTVMLVVTDTIGCSDTMSYSVFVDIPSFISFAASPTEICVGGQVYFKDSFSANTISRVYDFDDGTVLEGLHNPVHTYENAGIYEVSYTADYLVCASLDTTVTIEVSEAPSIFLGEDRTLCPFLDSIVVLGNKQNPAQILSWSTGERAPSIIVTANEVGDYWATFEDKGCVSVDTVSVKRDCYLNIPNSFSPNGDGRNDYFLPRQLLSSGVIGFSMTVMNRWGEVVFETSNVEGRGWDGNFGGQQQPMGAYVYLIEATWKNGYSNSFKGTTTLIR